MNLLWGGETCPYDAFNIVEGQHFPMLERFHTWVYELFSVNIVNKPQFLGEIYLVGELLSRGIDAWGVDLASDTLLKNANSSWQESTLKCWIQQGHWCTVDHSLQDVAVQLHNCECHRDLGSNIVFCRNWASKNTAHVLCQLSHLLLAFSFYMHLWQSFCRQVFSLSLECLINQWNLAE